MHRLHTRSALLVVTALLLLAAACAKSEKSDTSQAGVESSPPAGTERSDPTGTSSSLAGVDDDLPPPDEEDFTGRARVVNLYVDDEGEMIDIDVWARRSFTSGPVLLAEDVGFGEASDYFATPESQSIIFTPAGTSSDGEEIAGMFSPGEGEQITAVLSWEEGDVSVPNYWEADPDGMQDVPAPPAPGEGLVILRAGQLIAWEDALADSVGGKAFHVGDGGGACLAQQRAEADGYQPSILGGTQPTMHDLPEGTARITLHEWPGFDECASEPVFSFDVEVTGGEQVLVLIYTADGESLDTLQLPIA